MSNQSFYCVILAGGTGTRFWPYSRKNYPKQFIDFFGTGHSMLQQTYLRFSRFIDKENILVVTSTDYADLVREQLPELPSDNILIEPVRRNTAPCVALAATHVYHLNPEASMLVTPADQFIMDEPEFQRAMIHGLGYVATHDKLLTVGMKPNRPDTGFGYIQIDEEVATKIYKVKSFTEKPELEFARFFVESGEFFWNSSIFLWNVKTVLAEIQKHLPELAPFVTRTMSGPLNTEHEKELVAQLYPSCPNISINYGILEKSDKVMVLTGDFGWSDLGTWNSFYECSPKDREQNVVIRSKSLLYNCKNNVVLLPENKLVVLKDISDCIVVEEGNVLVVCKREDAANIRQFVNDAQVKLGENYI
jgi:mannose-1-phosphate guanylyltransferase